MAVVELAYLYDAGRVALSEIDVLEYRLISELLRAESDAKTDAKSALDAAAAALGTNVNASKTRG